MRTATIALCALAIAAACLPSAAHDHATGVVKERMEMMESHGQAHEGDPRADRRQARSCRDQSGRGGHRRRMRRTSLICFRRAARKRRREARGTIWQNWPDFERKATALEVESKKLVNTSADDLDALGAQARAVTEACGACHEKYRTKRRKGDM